MPHIVNDVKLDFKDVLIKPKRSTLESRSQVCLDREYTFKWSAKKWNGIPIVAANMDTTGTFEMAIQLSKYKIITAIAKAYTLSDWTEFEEKTNNFDEVLKYLAVSSGTSESDMNKLYQILERYPGISFICLDVANGYSQHFVDCIRKVRERYPQHTIMAGNVVTSEMTEELIMNGADIVKVGIGPGSVCTTRVKTGVGYPQLSAVIECADAAHGLGGHIISDGGCSVPGDVAKAFAGGADFVMIGGMFAGSKESDGETIEKNGKQVKVFYGMSSKTAMNKHAGGIAEYRASEGKTVEVEYKGPIKDIVQDICGGLRSTCTYVGAAKLKELSKRTTFIRVTSQENRIFTGKEV